MKLTTLLLFAALIGLKANTSYSQKTKITLNRENVSVISIIDDIEATTDFKFVYNTKFVDVDRKVTLKVKQETILAVLNLLFENTETTFTVEDRQVILVKKQQNSSTAKGVKTGQDPILISGKVTDTEGVPLSGASVIVIGTRVGVSTDFDGDYEIRVPNTESELEFSFIGYTTQKITVDNQTTINVILKEAVGQLDEVVVSTGYWQEDRRVSTANIEKIDAKTIGQQPVLNPLQTIQGQVPGVQIIQNSGLPGGGVDIRIRGLNSLRRGLTDNGNFPLYVIDGVPFPSAPLNTPLLSSPINRGNPLNSINPSDIETIEILKDAVATAIYGSLGANGVVVITTKRATERKGISVDLNYSHGLGEVAQRMDLLNTEQYLEVRAEGFANDGTEPNEFSPFDRDVLEWGNRETDWQDLYFGGTASITNAQLSISGGNGQTSFNLGGTFNRQTNVTPGDFAFTSGSGRIALNHFSADRKFNLDFAASYTANKNDLLIFDPVRQATTKAPNAPPFINEDGSLNFEDILTGNLFARLNADFIVQDQTLNSSLTLSYNLSPSFKVSTRVGLNRLSFNQLSTTPISSFDPAFGITTASASYSDGSTDSWIAEPQLEYNQNIGEKGKLSVLLGGTVRSSTNERETIIADGFQDDSSLENPFAAATIRNIEYVYAKYNYIAGFARINMNWAEKYILDLTGRRDGSSRFGPDRRFGNFGAIGAAWIFSKEQVFRNSFLSFGKIRGSYGTTGNDQIPDYRFLDSYQFSGNPYLGVPGLNPTRIANPTFGWENTSKLEGSLELGFFDNRISLTSTYFRNRSSNQLVDVPLPGTTGFGGFTDNFDAVVENRGWEFALATINVKSSNFNWTSSINLTIPKNELIEYDGIESSPFADRFRVGRSLFVRPSFETSVDPETGIYMFNDINEDGEINNDDLVFDNEVAPKFFGGIRNDIKYKEFELSFLFDFTNQTGLDFIAGIPGSRGNQRVDVLNRWQQEGDITNIQRFTSGFTPVGFQFFTAVSRADFRVVDASYIRLRNVSLSWTIPTELQKKYNLPKTRFYFQGQNLLTITGYNGLDPETGASALPPLRILTTGVQITF